MKNKIIISLLAAGLLAGGLFTSKSYAADDSGTAVAPAPARGMFLQRILARLNLTPTQETQIKAILAAQKDTLTLLLGEWHEARIGLRTAIQTPGATPESVRAAAAKVASVEADLAVERLTLYNQIMPVLDEQQKETIVGLEQSADDFLDNIIARIGTALTN